MSHWHRGQHKQADSLEPRWSRQRWSQHSPPWPRSDKKKWHFVWEPRPVTLSTLPEALRQNWKFHSQSKLINGPLPLSLTDAPYLVTFKTCSRDTTTNNKLLSNLSVYVTIAKKSSTIWNKLSFWLSVNKTFGANLSKISSFVDILRTFLYQIFLLVSWDALTWHLLECGMIFPVQNCVLTIVRGPRRLGNCWLSPWPPASTWYWSSSTRGTTRHVLTFLTGPVLFSSLSHLILHFQQFTLNWRKNRKRHHTCHSFLILTWHVIFSQPFKVPIGPINLIQSLMWLCPGVLCFLVTLWVCTWLAHTSPVTI